MINQITSQSKHAKTKSEQSQAKYGASNSESWSDEEDDEIVKNREQGVKVQYLIKELSKIKVQNKELENKLIEAERAEKGPRREHMKKSGS